MHDSSGMGGDMSCDPGRARDALLWCLKTGTDRQNQFHFFRGRDTAIAGAATNDELKLITGCTEMLEDHDGGAIEVLQDCRTENPGWVLKVAREIMGFS